MFPYMKLMVFGTTTTVAFGVGPLGPVLGDFLLAWGLLLIQGDEGSSSDGAPPTALCRHRGCLAGGLGCNFGFFVDLSVMMISLLLLPAANTRK